MEQTQQSIESVKQLTELMNKAGVAIVVVAVFMVIVLAVSITLISVVVSNSKKKDQRYEKLFLNMLEQNKEYINGVLHPNQGELFKASVECGEKVESHLKYLFQQTKADRVALYVFHNGQRMLNGGHFLKMSCLNEYALAEKYQYTRKHKDTPITQFSEICKALLSRGCWSCEDTRTLKDASLKAWVQEYGYKSIFIKAVFSTRGDVIGFATTEYIEDYVFEEKVATAKTETRRFADKVSLAIDAELIKEES